MSTVTTRNTTWETPYTWSSGELVTAALLNSKMSNEFGALKSPAFFRCYIDEASDYTITNTTAFTNIDGTDLAPSVLAAGGNWLVGFTGLFAYSSGTSGRLWLNVAVDGTDAAADDGIMVAVDGVTRVAHSFTWLLTGVSVGSRNFALRWKTNSASAVYTLHAGAGTANYDIHPMFWGIELA